MKELNYLDITKTNEGHIKLPSANGIHPDMGVGTAQQIQTNIHESDSTPYVFRKTPFRSTRETDKLVGASVAWNQLLKVPNNSKTDRGVTASFNSTTGVITLSGTSTTTYAWVFDTVDFVSGHKYLRTVNVLTNPNNIIITPWANGVNWTWTQDIFSCNASGVKSFGITGFSATNNLNGITLSANFVDLTLALGSTIADYIYTLESGTAGAGVAKLREWGFFDKPYYAYNAGGIESVNVSSHKMVGLNIFDEAWVSGSFDANGELIANANWSASEHFMPVDGKEYYFVNIDGISSSANAYVFYYDGAQKYIDKSTSLTANTVVALPANCAYIKVQYKQKIANVVNYPVCINISNPSVNGQYAPYELHEYPIADITLRGILKLDGSNNLYADGDTLESDGTHKTRYGIVELGALENWVYYSSAPGYFECVLPAAPYNNGECKCSLYMWSSATSIAGMTDKTIRVAGTKVYVVDSAYTSAASFKTAMSGVYLVYPLANPTTETTDPYTNPQVCNGFGTEEYVDRAVAAGTRDVAIPCGHNTEYMKNIVGAIEGIPLPPTTNGNYKLRCTVASGVPTYSWVSE